MEGFNDVSPETLHQWLNDGEAVAVDVREHPELVQARLAGAVHVPLSAFDPGQVPKEDGKKVVFFCAVGQRSEQIGMYLIAQGLLDEAYNLAGGLMAWAEAGLPLEFGPVED